MRVHNALTEKRIFLIDGNSQAYQAYYAIKSGMSSPDGQATNAVYGFTMMLLKILREKKPDYLAVAFDTPEPTFRHEAYAEYKAHRKPMPDDLVPQMDIIREVLEGYCVPVYAVPGYEADDVLATLATIAAGRGVTAVIVTRDKDALQLLGPRIVRWDNKSDRFYTAEDLKEEMDIAPEQVVEMMALSGDAVDNVPGIRGVGPKTALTLIQRYGTLENVLAHAGEVSGPKLRASLEEQADEARMSRELVVLDREVPLEADFDNLKVCRPDRRRLSDVFRRLDFRTLLPAVAETSEETDARYVLVDNEERLAELAAQLRDAHRFAFDVETTGLSPVDSRLVGMSFSVREGEGWYVPVLCPLGEKCLPLDRALEVLKGVLEDAGKKKVGQNLKYDWIVLLQRGIAVRRRRLRHDGRRLSARPRPPPLQPRRPRGRLPRRTARSPSSDLIGKGKKQITHRRVACARWPSTPARTPTWACGWPPASAGAGRRPSWCDLFERGGAAAGGRPGATWSGTGIGVDTDQLGEMSARVRASEIAELEARIYAEAGARVQHRLAAAARRGALREAEAAARQAHEDRLLHRRRRAGTPAPRTRSPALVLEYRS